MIFVLRTRGEQPRDSDLRIALARRTPDLVADGADQVDLFCVGDDSAPDRLRAQGWNVVLLHDGWYEDGNGGGVAVWGQGHYYELRDTPFSVTDGG